MSLLILYHCQNKVTTVCPFFIYLETTTHISIPGHVFLNFSGTAQNWMAIVVPPHCPLPHGSSFLELDYLRRNRPLWGFVELHRCLTQTWCQMDDASPRWPIDAHGCASWLHRLVKLIDFQWKTSCLPSVLFACYAQRWYPSSVHLGCVGDAVVFHVGAILSHNWLWTKCFLEEGSTFY